MFKLGYLSTCLLCSPQECSLIPLFCYHGFIIFLGGQGTWGVEPCPCCVCQLLVRFYLIGQHQTGGSWSPQALSSKQTLHFNEAVWFRLQVWNNGMWPIWVAKMCLDALSIPGLSGAHLSADRFECLADKSIGPRWHCQLPCVLGGIRVSRNQVVLFFLHILLICCNIEININLWEKIEI